MKKKLCPLDSAQGRVFVIIQAASQGWSIEKYVALEHTLNWVLKNAFKICKIPSKAIG